MATSFFTERNDLVFLARSANFSTLISASPLLFGLTSSLASSYAAKQAIFAAAMTAISNPDTKNKALVIAKNTAKTGVKALAVELARLVTGTSTVTDEQLAELGLSIRATPTNRPAPGIPYNYKTTINYDGSLDVTFKCDNHGSAGTFYQVWRKIGTAGEFTYLCGVGQRKFIDNTIPAGSSLVVYKIQAVRTTSFGPWAMFVVNFGVSASGETVATVDASPVKIAA